MGAGRFSIESVFRATDRVTRPITRMTGKVQQSFRRIGSAVNRVNTKMKAMARTARSSFGVGGVAGAIAVTGLAIRSVITKGAEFEQALVGAAARFTEPIEKGTEAWKALEEQALSTGAATEFTATSAARGLGFLAKAGFSAVASLKLLPGIVNLATASELELARASDIASDAIGAFGKMVKDPEQLAKNFARVSDSMSKATNSANLDLETLFETIKKGAPAATAAGVSMETFIALTGRLANMGLKGSDAGTALKNVFLKLADKGVQKKLKNIGVAVKDVETGELRDFADILDDIATATVKGKKIDVAGFINEVFGLRGVTAVVSLLGEGTEGLRNLRRELLNSTGSTDILAQKLRETRSGALKELGSAWESLVLQISKSNDTGIATSIEQATAAVRALSGFFKNFPAAGKALGILVAMLGVALALGLVVAGIAAAISFVAGSAVAAGIATAALVAANVAWLASFDPIKRMIAWVMDRYKILALVADSVGVGAQRKFNQVRSSLGLGGGEPLDESDPDAARRANEQLPALPFTGSRPAETREISQVDLNITGAPAGSQLTTKGRMRGVSLRLVESGGFA